MFDDTDRSGSPGAFAPVARPYPPAAGSGWLTRVHVGPQQRAAKTFTLQDDGSFKQTDGYRAGRYVALHFEPVADIDALLRLLVILEERPGVYVVRGRPTPAFYAALRRGHLPDQFARRTRPNIDGAVVTIEDAPNCVIALDIDDYEVPDGLDIRQRGEEIARRFIEEKLPPAFHDVDCVVQLSSSAGLGSPKFKAHLFFFSDRGVARQPLEDWLRLHSPKAEGGVDPATLRPAQPIYTAAPVLLPEGTPDPLAGKRVFLWRGTKRTVTLPSDDEMRAVVDDARAAFADVEDVRERRRRGKGASVGRKGVSAAGAASIAVRSTRTPESALALVGDELASFHEPLRRAIWLYARDTFYGRRTRDDESFRLNLEAVVRAAPRAPGRDIGAYLDRAYFDNSLASARAKIKHEVETAAAARAGDDEQRPYLPVEAARTAAASELKAFMHRVRWWWCARRTATPPSIGLCATVGLGKTRALALALVEHVAFTRMLGLPHRVVVWVPNHRLAGDVAERLRGAGLSVAVWRGLDAEDPAAPMGEDGARPAMCRNPGAVRDAIAAGLPVERAACGNGKGASCAHRAGCAWLTQRGPAKRADVVVAASAGAFLGLPTALRSKVGLYAFDEGWWQGGLAEETITLDSLSDLDDGPPVLTNGEDDDGATRRLAELRARLARLLAAVEGQALDRDALLRAGLTPAACHDAARLEWRRVPKKPALRPGMAPEARAAALAGHGGRVAADAGRFARLWGAIAEAASVPGASARIVIERATTAAGAVRQIRLRLRRTLAKPIRRAPVLALDATLPEKIVREWFPRIEVLTVLADAPHQRVALIPGPWGKSSMLPHDKARPEERRRRENRIAEVRDFLGFLGRRGPTLLICNKALVPLFGELPGVEVAHFNAIAGLDRWGSVRSLVVIGAPMPRPEDVERLAAGMWGVPVDAHSSLVPAPVRMRCGGTRPVEARRYADARAEAIRAAIMDSEIVQAVGRGRGVNRGPDRPLDVWLFTNAAPSGLIVDEIVEWRPLTGVERMMLRGVLLKSPGDAAAVWPDLFPTEGAAKESFRRYRAASVQGGGGQLVTFPYSTSLTGERYQLDAGKAPEPYNLREKTAVAVDYRPQGARRGSRRAWIAPDRLGDAHELIRAALGDLAAWTPEHAAPPHSAGIRARAPRAGGHPGARREEPQ